MVPRILQLQQSGVCVMVCVVVQEHRDRDRLHNDERRDYCRGRPLAADLKSLRLST